MHISSISTDLESLSEESLSTFDCVCIISADIVQMIRINNICRARKIGFWGSDTFGLKGYIFCDLGAHDYITEQKLVKKGKPDQIRKDSKTATYSPIEEVIKHNFGAIAETKRFKRVSHPLFFAIISLTN